MKYSSQLAEPEKVFQALQIDPAELSSAPGNDSNRIKELLEKLSGVKEWTPSAAKGRFAFDEKKFYQSIVKQFNDGKTLSAKQIAALDKLAAKYLN